MGVNIAIPTDTDLNRDVALGAGWIRIAYEGSWISNGNYSRPATIIKHAHDRGLRVIATAMSVPGLPMHTFSSDPAAIATFATYAWHLASLGADVVEIWNEENGNYFSKPGVNPGLFAQYQVAAYDRIHASFNIPVISGGYQSGSGADAPLAFDNAAKAANPNFDSHRDGIADHPYDWSGTDPRTDPIAWNAFAQAVPLHNANPTKPFYITEIGSPSGPAGTKYNEARQANWFRWYNQGIDRWGFVPVVTIWHTENDGTAGIGTAVEPFFGILRANGSNKPVTNEWYARAGQTP